MEKKIEEKINKIQEKIFFLDMKDTWSNKDYDLWDKYQAELREARKELEKCKKNN